jgi:lipopolysaccharide biosynthesis glycosyltransferase
MVDNKINKLIIFGTDENYLNHIKYNIANIRDKHGEIDICIIYDKTKEDKIKPLLEQYNVLFLPVSSPNGKSYDRAYHLKYHVFETYFKSWDKILYLDCDTMIFDKLDVLFDLLNESNNLFVDFEKNTIKDFFTMWSPIDSSNIEDYNLLAQETDINKYGFNGGIFLYNSSIIKEDTIKNLYHLDEKYKKINKHVEKGTDQPIINLIYSQIAQQIPNHYFSFWTEYNYNNIISHFCRWDPPWTNLAFNNKIGMSYADYYNKTLNAV